MIRYCQAHNSGHPRHQAFAVVTLQPSGNRAALCQPILNVWLDNADDDPSLEPSEIKWLPPSGWREELKRLLGSWGYGPQEIGEALARPWVQALVELVDAA